MFTPLLRGVREVYATHKFVATPEQAAAVSINATTDLDLGHDAVYSDYLQKALTDGLVSINTIKDSVWRNFYWRMRLGDFDPPSMVQYQSIDKTHLNTPASQVLNERIARESIVLLKNEKNILPMSVFQHRITLIGPNANASRTQLANYEGIPDEVISVYDGILYALVKSQSHTEFGYTPACEDVACTTLNKSRLQEAVFAASQAQTVVLVLGLSGRQEGEGHDRAPSTCKTSGRTGDVLDLPGCQLELLQAIAHVGRPIVLVLMNGGPVSVPWAVENIDTIVEIWYPGARGGLAVAEVLFGETSPAGRMPVTTVQSSADLRDSKDYSMTPTPGRTYKYFGGKPLFPFGYGLSYTTFTYSEMKISATELQPCSRATVTAVVTNSGMKRSDEVPQLYVKPPAQDGYTVPLISLQGFDRVHIAVGKAMTVEFPIDPMSLSVVNENGIDVVNPGDYTIYVGGHAPMAGFTDGILSGSLKVTGQTTPLSECTGVRKCYACDQ